MPPLRYCRKCHRCLVRNTMSSKMHPSTSGRIAHSSGLRLTQADSSIDAATSGAYQSEARISTAG